MRLSTVAALLVLTITPLAQQPMPAQKGQRLDDVTWLEADRLLTFESIVVIPLGAGSKEHGPHLKLRNDLTMADYLTRRVVDASSVVVAPTLTYHYYPAFLEYPGSTSLTLATARDMTTDVVRSLAAYGPRRFYVLNTGISTLAPLAAAAQTLAQDGILLRYTDLDARLTPTKKTLMQQPGGTHADEIETSMMLYIDPASVDMAKAQKDFSPAPAGGGPLTRQRGGRGTYSPTGTWGDPTLATAAKGRTLVEALVTGILDDIAQLRTAPLPSRGAPQADTSSNRAAPQLPAMPSNAPQRTCGPAEERTIRAMGFTFASAWNMKDARRLASLWAPQGDIIHPDGTVEQGAELIEQNRQRLFSTREYRSSSHSLQLNLVRCLTADIVIADGKWELTGVVDKAGLPVPKREGQVTLVIKRAEPWAIEAYRYTVK
jgi:creatinine amidohydrolase